MTLSEYLAEARGRCEKATEGPWGGDGPPDIIRVVDNCAVMAPADVDFIAHSRADVEALVKMVILLRAKLCVKASQFRLVNPVELERDLAALIPPSAEGEKP